MKEEGVVLAMLQVAPQEVLPMLQVPPLAPLSVLFAHLESSESSSRRS
jgi:hypothetical protein